MNELAVLEALSHPNMMRIYELLEDKDHYHIVSELIRGGDMMEYIEELEATQDGKFTEADALTIIK